MHKSILLLLLNIFVLSQALADEGTEYFPLVSEGKKWVNEKVIVNHGDTTRYYYIYEINGDDPDWHWYSTANAKMCHYYTGSGIDINNDSIIASLEERNSSTITICFNNRALDRVDKAGRCMFERLFFVGMDEGETLYFIDPSYVTESLKNYLWFQTEPALLNEDNCFEIEPIEIEGYQCYRIAHVNELGEPQCYLVQGIGFDSYNMGDLLTPFTREPDPDADYQEWCGLCHVIKDGKIIYKGMRYTPDNMTGLDEVVTDRPREGAAALDPNYYNLMGQPVGTTLPSVPGIYIHHGNKILVK